MSTYNGGLCYGVIWAPTKATEDPVAGKVIRWDQGDGVTLGVSAIYDLQHTFTTGKASDGYQNGPNVYGNFRSTGCLMAGAYLTSSFGLLAARVVGDSNTNYVQSGFADKRSEGISQQYRCENDNDVPPPTQCNNLFRVT